MIRLHVQDALADGLSLIPSAEQQRYLMTVMRRAPGDEVAVFNGRDGEWRARIDAAGRKGCALALVEQTRAQANGPDLDLVVALVKRSRLEIIVEKAAELGARRVLPAITQRTNADHTNIARLTAIAVEASEQTGRLDPPTVAEPQRLDRLLDGWEEGRKLMYCDEAGDDPNAHWGGEAGRAVIAPRALEGFARGEPWAVLIGPEGGFSPEERDRIRSLPFATPVSLGPRILRADTAAIAALTLWQAVLGDWS